MAITLAIARMSPALPPPHGPAMRADRSAVLRRDLWSSVLDQVHSGRTRHAHHVHLPADDRRCRMADRRRVLHPGPVVSRFSPPLRGLALALHAPHADIDWRGVAWAVFTAVVFSAVLIVSGRTMRGVDRRILMLYLTSTAVVIVGAVSLALVPLEWPRTDHGWTLLAVSTGALRARHHPALHRGQDDRPHANRDHRQQRTPSGPSCSALSCSESG